jgi:hypothetical protein
MSKERSYEKRGLYPSENKGASPARVPRAKIEDLSDGRSSEKDGRLRGV